MITYNTVMVCLACGAIGIACGLTYLALRLSMYSSQLSDAYHIAHRENFVAENALIKYASAVEREFLYVEVETRQVDIPYHLKAHAGHMDALLKLTSDNGSKQRGIRL